tara:strand:+ start:71678 stop:72229 length:552 start_codon:yes stop_codon:yes gene_type:complete
VSKVIIRSVADLSSFSSKESIVDQVKEIFFLQSNKKTFENDLEKNKFFNRWLNVYIKNFPDQFYLALKEEKVLGYLCYCQDTIAFIHKFGSLGGQEYFQNEMIDFPAHLHINVRTPGMGIGELLMNYTCEKLHRDNITGVHIITSPDSLNVSFYKRHDFNFTQAHTLKDGVELFFMGRVLQNQ